MDILIKTFLDEKFSKIEGNISYIGKEYKKFKLLNNKKSVEEVLIQRVVKTNSQTLYDKGLFDKYDKADEVLNYFLFVERRRLDLEEVNGVIQ